VNLLHRTTCHLMALVSPISSDPDHRRSIHHSSARIPRDGLVSYVTHVPLLVDQLLTHFFSQCVTDNAAVSAGSTDASKCVFQHTYLVSPPCYIHFKVQAKELLSRGIIMSECHECEVRVGQRCMWKGPELHVEDLSECDNNFGPVCNVTLNLETQAMEQIY
jgi:hypothetical protein